MMIRAKDAKWLTTALALAIALALVLPMASMAGKAQKSDYARAMDYYYSGKYEQAASLLKEYVKDHADPKAYFRLGYSLYKLGKHEEANKYFEQSYLLTPKYSPTPELESKHKRLKNVRPEGYYNGKIIKAPEPKEQPAAEDIPDGMMAVEVPSTIAVPGERTAVTNKTAPVEKAAVTNKAAPTEKAAVANKAAPPEKAAVANKAAPPEKAAVTNKAAPTEKAAVVNKTAPPARQPARVSKQKDQAMPGGFPMDMTEDQAKLAIMTFLTAFMIPIAGALLLLYLLFSLCLFKIAQKLGTDKPFLAWIPLAQAFPFAWAAGKSNLWGIIFLISTMFLGPIGFLIGLYFWILITEKLGKNKFLGLIMLVPLINIAFMAFLAFSKATGVAGAGASAATDISGEPNLDLPDVPDDFDDFGGPDDFGDFSGPDDMGDMGDMGDIDDMGDMDTMELPDSDFNESDLE